MPSSPGVCSKLARLTKLKTHHMKNILPIGTANAFISCKETITKNAFNEAERIKMMQSFYRASKKYPVLLKQNTNWQDEA